MAKLLMAEKLVSKSLGNVVSPGFDYVAMGEAKVSRRPLVSVGFFCCRGLIAYNSENAGLLHTYSDGDYSWYLKWFAAELGGGNVRAICVGERGKPWPRRIEDICELASVPLDVAYRSRASQRHIVVLPEQRRVDIYNKDAKRIKQIRFAIKS